MGPSHYCHPAKLYSTTVEAGLNVSMPVSWRSFNGKDEKSTQLDVFCSEPSCVYLMAPSCKRPVVKNLLLCKTLHMQYYGRKVRNCLKMGMKTPKKTGCRPENEKKMVDKSSNTSPENAKLAKRLSKIGPGKQQNSREIVQNKLKSAR